MAEKNTDASKTGAGKSAPDQGGAEKSPPAKGAEKSAPVEAAKKPATKNDRVKQWLGDHEKSETTGTDYGCKTLETVPAEEGAIK